MSTRTKIGKPLAYRPPAWAPGRFCPRCTSTRHQSWYVVARCRWRKAEWVTGNPPASGPCFALLAHCRF
jgi:hypothetical protein